MNPAELSVLVRDVTTEVLRARDLDTSVVPEQPNVERPRNPEHGDYATNIAMQLGKRVGLVPRELATALAEALSQRDGVDSAEVAGPGFINVRLAKDAQGKIVSDILAAGAAWGGSEVNAGKKVNLEFVSANPTGLSISAAPVGPQWVTP